MPGIVHHRIDVGRVGRIPHIVLQEPEEGVAENVVVLVVGTAGGNDEAEVEVLPWKGGLNMGIPRLLSSPPVALPHSAGDPRKLHILAHGTEGGDHTPTSPAALEPTILSKMVFHRPAVRGEDKASSSLELPAELHQLHCVDPVRCLICLCHTLGSPRTDLRECGLEKPPIEVLTLSACSLTES